MPPHRKRQEAVALRLLASLFGIVTLEVIRYYTFRADYETDPSLWLIIGGAIAFNIWFQWWTLPDTRWKALLAAALAQVGLPPAARIFANATVVLAKALAPLIAPR